MSALNFRIGKGTHVSHFHEKCPRWPMEDFYEQEKPLWWGSLCADCSKLADIEAAGNPGAGIRGQGRN
jgi:hypothetical protein